MSTNFPLGRILATPGVLAWAEKHEANEFMQRSLGRHAAGDWGELDKDDKKENDRSVNAHLRIVSAYIHPDSKTKIWIITEADRSATTILLPEEY